jgi:hypothetical protein
MRVFWLSRTAGRAVQIRLLSTRTRRTLTTVVGKSNFSELAGNRLILVPLVDIQCGESETIQDCPADLVRGCVSLFVKFGLPAPITVIE